jgi:hypothetical protein
MKKAMGIVNFIIMVFVLANTVQAEVLTFEDGNNLGVTLGGSAWWNGWGWWAPGGGHLILDGSNNDDYIYFSTPTHLNDFQMNGSPWEGYGYGPVGGILDIAAFGYGGAQLWSSTVDLSNYTSWDKWLTVSVEKDNVTNITFYATGGFFPSVDNMRINESTSVTPEPASMLLFGLGGVSLGFFHRLKRKKVA